MLLSKSGAIGPAQMEDRQQPLFALLGIQTEKSALPGEFFMNILVFCFFQSIEHKKPLLPALHQSGVFSVSGTLFLLVVITPKERTAPAVVFKFCRNSKTADTAVHSEIFMVYCLSDIHLHYIHH